MSKLSPTMINVLHGIIHPAADDEPFPPLNTLHALKSRGLIEVYRPENDVFATMTGALAIRATDKGREALEDALFDANEAAS